MERTPPPETFDNFTLKEKLRDLPYPCTLKKKEDESGMFDKMTLQYN